jgi:hypothetical protein
MDSDIVMLRPFPFAGEHFFNLQWRGGNVGHFICGNVIYAKRYSRHLRNLYEISINRFFDGQGSFGEVGPRLLSDYVASSAGGELRDWLFSPMFFNPIDWTEIGRFDQPIAELADYLNDERVFGVHLWNARTYARPSGDRQSLISQLSDPLGSFPSLTHLADRFATDKNRITGNRHGYARIYDRLLSGRRFTLRRLMELKASENSAERRTASIPSVDMWHAYFPFCHVIGVDRADLSHLDSERFTGITCDPSKREDLSALLTRFGPGSMEMIIDDASHASFAQQLALRELFPLLADGGWYFIEDLDWQPPGEERGKIALTKMLLREIRQHGRAQSLDPLDISALAEQIEEILFFDSQYELERAKLLGGLVAIRKRGGSGFVR